MPKPLVDKSKRQQRFVQALQRKYTDPSYANIKYLLYQKTTPIAESFINLAIVEQQEQQQKEEKSLHDNSIFHDALLSSYENIYTPRKPIKLADIFVPHREQRVPKHILIEGVAGIGKSTLCQYIAYHWATQSTNGVDFTFLIWLPLRNLANYSDDAINLAQLVHQECLLVKDQQLITVTEVEEQLAELQGRVLFLLDGYDEVANLLKERVAISQLLKSLWQQEYWLLTSRPYYVTQEIVGLYRHLETIGFTDENIEHYINIFFKKFKQPKKGLALIQEVKANKSIAGVAHIPINLELICTAWCDNELTANSKSLTMTQLYRQVVLNLLRRYLQSEAIPTEDLLETDVEQHWHCQAHLQFLQALAWTALEQGTLLLSPVLFQPLLEKYRPPNTQDRSKFYEAVFKKFHLLKSTGEQKVSLLQQHYYFVHLTFQEYLAAAYLVECICNNSPPQGYTDFSDFVNQKHCEPRYEIVWWFVAGILQARDANKLLDFFSLVSQAQHPVVTIYSVLPFIRYLEESQLPKSMTYLTKNLFELIIEATMNNGYLQKKTLHYLSLSPQLCHAINIENEIVKLLNEYVMSAKPGRVTQLLILIGDSRFLGVPSINALLTLLQNDRSYSDRVFTVLSQLVSNNIDLIQHIPQRLLFDAAIHAPDFVTTVLTLKNIINLMAHYAEINDDLINFILKYLEPNENYYEPILAALLMWGKQKKN